MNSDSIETYARADTKHTADRRYDRSNFREGYASTASEWLINRFTPLPPNAVLFGAALTDGRAVLLDLEDPDTGPILIIGEKASGKTALLQTIASGVMSIHKPQNIQFAVITSNYMEWMGITDSPHCGGIFSPNKPHFTNIIDALDIWMRRPDCSQALLVFIDGLEILSNLDGESHEKLQALLTFGPRRKIWPIATMDINNLNGHKPLTSYFKKHVASFAKNNKSTRDLEFIMRERSSWCRFSI